MNSIEALARRALALDSGDAEAHCWLGAALIMSGDPEGALAESERALVICPNLAFAHGALGAALIYSGRPEQGLAAVETYMRLDPRDPMVANFLHQVVVGNYLCRQYEDAVDAAKRVIRSYPDLPLSYRWLAAALGQIGSIAEAKEALEKAMSIAPASFYFYVRQRPPWMRPEDYAHMLEGLRKAGWGG